MTKTWKLDKADETQQHFWTDTDGAHISSTGDHDTSGFHQLLTSVKNVFMHGTTELATFGENLIELGKNSTSAVIKFCAGTGEIGVIDSMLTLFADKVGVKGNSQAVLASNGESNVAAGKTNTTYTGLSQTAATAPSTDADPATALLQAKCTKNSDSSTVSETYINLTAKPDGTAPATVKASDIEVLSSRETNPYIAVKNNANTLYTVPVGKTIAMTTRDSYGRPSDSGIGFDGTNVFLGGANVVVNGKTHLMVDFEKAIASVPKILWENPNPTATFAGQTVNLAANSCNHFGVIAKSGPSAGDYRIPMTLFDVGSKAVIFYVGGTGGPDDGTPYNLVRQISASTQTSVTFGVGATSAGAGSVWSLNNDRVIPLRIVGFTL